MHTFHPPNIPRLHTTDQRDCIVSKGWTQYIGEHVYCMKQFKGTDKKPFELNSYKEMEKSAILLFEFVGKER